MICLTVRFGTVWKRRARLVMLAGCLGWLSTPAVSAAPVCNRETVGLVACVANRECVCRFERGGTLTGRARGYRWDCGILRPQCFPPPAEVDPPAFRDLGGVIVDLRGQKAAPDTPQPPPQDAPDCDPECPGAGAGGPSP